MKKKKFLSWLLVSVMCLTLIPATAAPVQAWDYVHAHYLCCGYDYYTSTNKCTCPEKNKESYTTTFSMALTQDSNTLKKGDATWSSETNGYVLEAGSYYLTSDLKLDKTLYINGDVSLCLNGNSIICDAGEASTPIDVIYVKSGVKFNLTDCKGFKSCEVTHAEGKFGRGVYNDGTFNFYGGNITGNKSGSDSFSNGGFSGAGVTNNNGATFTMYGGSITENKAVYGGGVYNSAEYSASHGTTFTMYGGTISDNEATSNGGGGVYNQHKFIMNGGMISENKATYEGTNGGNGGGVYNNNDGVFTMSGGTISYNTAAQNTYANSGLGGGVYNSGTFSLCDGTIFGNRASQGGGVYPANADKDVMTLSGKARIAGNKAGEVNSNLYLPSGKTVAAKGLTEGAGIGVSSAVDVATSQTNVGVTSDAVDVNYFTSDDSRLETMLTPTKLVALTQHTAGNEQHSGHKCVCGATHSNINGHTDSTSLTNWVGVSDLNLITGAGNYYLTGNVTLTEAFAYGSGLYCGWKVPDGVVLCLNGNTITMDNPANLLNYKNDPAPVDVILVTGQFTLTDCKTDNEQGKITHATGKTGRGITVLGGTLNMYGGQIDGNKTTEYGSGGGVLVEGVEDATSLTTFNLYGGSITNNQSGYGGGVYVTRVVWNGGSQFNMYGGSINNNTSTVSADSSSHGVGGGVCVGWTAVFKMTGGSITGNTAKFGGAGVFLEALARSYESDNGGTAKFEVSGSPIITGNTVNNQANNVYLCTSTTDSSHWEYVKETVDASITILDGLSDSAQIGVTTEKTPTSGNRVLAATGADNNKDYKTIFTSDVSGYEVQNLKNTTLMLAVTGDTKPEPDHVHNWTYKLKDGSEDTIVATCDVAGCSSSDGGSVQILKPTQLKPNQAATLKETNWQGEEVTVKYVKYIDGGGTSYPFEYLPTTAPATYHAQITLGTVTAKTEPYTITEDGSTPTTHTHSWSYTTDGSTISANCTAADCPLTNKSGGSITITAPTNLTYDGKAKAATLTENNWKADAVDGITISYKQGENPLTAAPTNAGTYTASITLDGKTANVKYTIEPATITVKAVDKSITVGGTAPDLTNPAKGTDYTVTGLASGDTLGGTINLKYMKDDAEVTPDTTQTGTYEIVVSGVTAPTGNNYNPTIDLKNGTLSIVKRSSGRKHSNTGTGTVTDNDSNSTTNNETSVSGNTGYATCGKGATCSADVFADVANTEWYHDGIHYCLDNGLMVGTSETTFSPDDQITRAQIVTMLWRKDGSPSVSGNGFKDVAQGAYYAQAVEWAASNNIVNGYGDELFGPDDSITREQLASILYRYAKYKGMDVSVGEDTNIMDFDDVSQIGSYAVSAIQWACGSGIMNGTDTYKISPQGSATRAQAACMIQRFLTGNK